MPILAAKTPGVTKAITPVCPKCGTNKNSGKVSCCIGGGAWFKKCGADSSKFEHTWTDGVEACKGVQSQSKLHHRQQIIESNAGSGSDVDIANCKDCYQIADIIVLTTSILITTLYM